MKTTSSIFLAVLFMLPAVCLAQSKSFQTLKHQFEDMHEVHSFAVGSFFARLALSFADDDDFDSDAIEKIGKIHIVTIPREHFESRKLTLEGYEKHVLQRDGYESLIGVRESGSNVKVFMQPYRNRENRYLFLIDDDHEVVAVEFSGYVNTEKLLSDLRNNNCQEL